MSSKHIEALEQIHELLSIGGKPDTAMCIRYEAANQIAKEALAAPLRNCDVGTAEEQARRMNRFCDNYGRYSDGEPKCDGCPLLRKVIEDGGKCELAWAQKPYEDGGAE